jgi:hypothetical protein
LPVPLDFGHSHSEVFLLHHLEGLAPVQNIDTEPIRLLRPFWDVLTAAPQGQRLVLQRDQVQIPFDRASARGPLRIKALGKSVFRASVPFLTNLAPLAPGHCLFSDRATLEAHASSSSGSGVR